MIPSTVSHALSAVDAQCTWRAVRLQLGFHLRQVAVEILDRVLLDLAGEFAEPVGVRKLIEKQFRPLLMRRLRALVHRRTRVGFQLRGELVNLLKAHGATTRDGD
jgi:hypothetical protein